MNSIVEISLKGGNLQKGFDVAIFENLYFPSNHYQTHTEIAKKLSDKSPYTITIIHDPLKAELMNKKEYVKKEKREISSKYIELLFDYFKNEFGEHKSQDIYHKWLQKYRNKWNKGNKYKNIDECIKIMELEPRYKKDILKKFKNHKKLMSPRFVIDRERYYNLPEPLNWIDWRTSYDNIFIWQEDGKKFLERGGGGSSGARETSTKFIYGYSLINKKHKIPSYLFLYNEKNELLFIKKFASLCVPDYFIGLNYDKKIEKNILSKTLLAQGELDKSTFKNKKLVVYYDKR